MNSPDLVVVSRFRSTADAQVAQGILYPALAGAELLVRAEDAEKASEALRVS